MKVNRGIAVGRQDLCEGIENVLLGVCAKLKIDSRLNHTSTHVYCEDAITGVLNLVFGLKLVNANVTEHNKPGFDLIDQSSKTFVQVSSDSSKEKIRHTLEQDCLKDYVSYKLMFMFLVEKRPKYKEPYPLVPNYIEFNIEEDVFDLPTLMQRISSLPDIRIIEEIHNLVEREFTRKPDLAKLPSGLGWVVETLSGHELLEVALPDAVAFNIDAKIVANGLKFAASEIHSYAAYTHILMSIYDAYAQGGSNRQLALFSLLRRRFVEVAMATDRADEQFIALVSKLCGELEPELLATQITREELELYVTIIVVDAFMRCKIYEGPNVLISASATSLEGEENATA